jgi:hypothetical protein
MVGVFISDINGNPIEVTDIKGALEQAKGGIAFHEAKMKAYKKNQSVIIFPNEYKYWVHILSQLEKLEMKLNAVVKEVKDVVTDTTNYSEPVLKARAMFKAPTNGKPMFIRNGNPSPLYGLQSNWLMFIKEPLYGLNVGDSIYNSSQTKITRVY